MTRSTVSTGSSTGKDGRTPARPRSPEYERRDEIARSQGFANYWEKRKALAAGLAGAEVDGRNPRWRAKQRPRRAA